MRWSANLDLQRSYRYYQSHLPPLQDAFHVGRRDRRDTIEPALSLSPTSDLDLRLSFTYDLRRTRTPDSHVAAIKNYVARAIELTIVYQVF